MLASRRLLSVSTRSISMNATQNVPVKATESSSSSSAAVTHAVVSVFDMFSIGIGPSSSHTVGPMRAAKIFMTDLREHNLLAKVNRLRVDLYGSLALTGVGHGTPNAILIGLEGESPESVDPTSIKVRVEEIKQCSKLSLMGHTGYLIPFHYDRDLRFNPMRCLPQHPNGMRFCAFDSHGTLMATNEYFSIGGGFVVNQRTRVSHGDNAFYKCHSPDQPLPSAADSEDRVKQDCLSAAIPFTNAADLIDKCRHRNLSIGQLVLENELHWQPDQRLVRDGILRVWRAMSESIQNGIHASSADQFLPGDLRVRRRAPGIWKKLSSATTFDGGQSGRRLPALDWLSLYAIAVNEENAAGGRVVTAPTNGAAGIIPAVLKYYLDFLSPYQSVGSGGSRDLFDGCKGNSSFLSTEQSAEVVEFLLTAAAIGMLYKRGSSISAAEVGCQGEIGVACSMASAALCAVMGGTLEQVENAAEIGMEHNLGLTCDPVGGMVQIPCIERNALGAVKAVTAAQLSLNGDGVHRVSLDQVIETMRQTGHDMQAKYKETSLGGLAVNVPLC